MAGFVPRHATPLRAIFFLSSLVFAVYLSFLQPDNSLLALIYFILAETMYIGFIMLVLSRKGFRLWFRKKWGGEDEGYKAYEGILRFLFFHNAVSMGYVASATRQGLDVDAGKGFLLFIIIVLFATGYLVKILAAKVVSIDIYYWKDMFLGKRVSEFVVSGPYKYLSNPMYGVGQIPAYASAIWYGSVYGLGAAIINQCLIFTFYYFFEKKFINRIYLNKYI
jgi:protein-S-isoprenylcysteine O-methyltransferase Ste14